MAGVSGKQIEERRAALQRQGQELDRRLVEIDGPVKAMASSDQHRSSLVMWNLSGADQSLNVRLDNLPFSKGTLSVYKIDKDHASWGDGSDEALRPVEERGIGETWSGSIPDSGVVYLEADDGMKASKPLPVAKVERVLYYFPNRKSTAYADFDRNTWTARLGTGESAEAVIGVRASGLPRRLIADVLGDNSVSIYVDYLVDGRCVKSVLFGGEARGAKALPWGKKSLPDEAVKGLDLDLAKHAPDGWKSSGIITFVLKGSGASTRAKIGLWRD